MSLRTPVCDLLKIDHPVLLAGMGGVSYAEVTAAVSEAGGFGCLGMASAGPEEIRAQMRRVRELTDKPFGVDLLTALPDSLEAACDVIIEEGASTFVSGLGVPTPIMGRLKDAGLTVMSMCGTVRHARKAEEAGVDAVIAQGTEAGGHTGRIAGMALIPQIVDAVNVPVIAAGSIVDGRGLAASLAFGAQAVWMGTRFIASTEAHAGRVYKQAIVDAGIEDTTVTRAYSGKPMRVLNNDYVQELESTPGAIRKFPDQAIHSYQEQVIGGIGGILEPLDKNRDCLPMGQGAGAVHEVLPCAEIVRRTVAEAEEVMARLGRMAAGGQSG
ncbi:MAG: NAD(P)H-dependent flavin oxidoreductase [Alphaproteobacteria bacterium]